MTSPQKCWTVLICSWAFFLAGCAPSETVSRPTGAETHEHYYAQSRTLGDKHYHATMEFDPRAGILAIVFLDQNEYPVKLLREDKIKATLIGPEGQIHELSLRHPGYRGYRFSSYRVAGYRQPPTDHYVLKEDWLRGLSSFNLKVWIPLQNTTYVVEYVYPQ